MQVAPRFTGHFPLKFAGEGVFHIAKEFLKFAVVNAGLLSSFHSTSRRCPAGVVRVDAAGRHSIVL
jgi:hypothetical protein